jgi:hypothetical protein
VPAAAFALLLALCAGPAGAADALWSVHAERGDIVASAAQEASPAFSAQAYARSLVPPGYRLDAHAPGDRCAIEIDLRPLSLLGDALSLEIIYRRLPGECATPLRSGGYQAVRAIRLGSAAPARIEDYAQPAALLQELRKTREIVDLIGADVAAAPTLPALFARLAEATARRCERRLSATSTSQFYVDQASGESIDLRIAWSNDCGQLGDEPQLESFPVTLRVADFKGPVRARVLDIPMLHLRFVSAD